MHPIARYLLLLQMEGHSLRPLTSALGRDIYTNNWNPNFKKIQGYKTDECIDLIIEAFKFPQNKYDLVKTKKIDIKTTTFRLCPQHWLSVYSRSHLFSLGLKFFLCNVRIKVYYLTKFWVYIRVENMKENYLYMWWYVCVSNHVSNHVYPHSHLCTHLSILRETQL